jgi:hypothetical protein
MTTEKKPRRYRLVFEEPPPVVTGRAAVKQKSKKNALREFLDKIDAEHPDTWVLVDRSSAKSAIFWYLRKEHYPHMEITTRRNPDKTVRVYVRMVSANKVSV